MSLPAVSSARLSRLEWRSILVILAIILALNVIAWSVLIGLVAPQHLSIGTKVFGLGIGVTAYTLGMRHAFDADHIAAIDNTTRKLLADGKHPVSVGFWFALGHSSIVVFLALGIAAGAKFITGLTSDGSTSRQLLGVVSTSASGLFLYLIGILNLVALIGIYRVFRRFRAGAFDHAALEDVLDKRGFLNRLLRPMMKSITRPAQMFPVGMLFGIGFDTASEVTLLVLAGSGAASGLPWYAILVLPLLFTAGMSLFDTLDGAFMNVAYRWAFANPIRKIYYNLTITGLSVIVALLIGTIELVSVLQKELKLDNPVTNWIADLDLNNVGFTIVALFILVWTTAIAYWKFGGIEDRWTPTATPGTLEMD